MSTIPTSPSATPHPAARPHRHAHDPLGDPHARLAGSLVLSLVLWAPFGMAAARSELDVVNAGLRYVVAFLGCRVAIGGIGNLLMTYRHLGRAAAAEVAPPAEDGDLD